MSKEELRKEYIQLRKALSLEALSEKNHSIFLKSCQLGPWSSAVHIFLSSNAHHEINTAPIIDHLWEEKTTIVVPRLINGTLKMDSILYTPQSKVGINKFGIREPIDGNIYDGGYAAVFIPLLVFDELGNRLGYGKGYYDYFLSGLGKETLKIGLSYFPPVKNIEGIQDHDIPLDLCITPSNIYNFNS